MTDGPRPFAGWVDEIDDWRRVLEEVGDQFAHRQLDPALEQRFRDMLAEGTVHHRPPLSTWLADVAAKQREDERVHAMRTAVEGLVARYAADHPDVVR